MSLPVAVLASRLRPEERAILAALDRRGADCVRLDTRTLTGQADAAPRFSAVLNREIGYARALRAAQLLEAQHVPVLNSAAATELCGDKWRATIALNDAGLPVPRTILALTPAAALAAFDQVGYPAVVKPLIGSWGRLVTKVTGPLMAAAVLEYITALPAPDSHIVYVQECVPEPSRDIRVIVLDGEPAGAMCRRGAQWRANIALGAVGEWAPLTAELGKLAMRAAEATAAAIAGVDLIEDRDGRLLVLEVNHGVEFAGFQQAAGDRMDVAARIAGLLMAAARAGAGR